MLSLKPNTRRHHHSESILAKYERLAKTAYCLGVLLLAIAAMTAWSNGIGIAIGAFVLLPFSLAAALNPTRWSIGLALAFWGCWFLALYYLLT